MSKKERLVSQNDNCHCAGTTEVAVKVTGGRGLEGVSLWPLSMQQSVCGIWKLQWSPIATASQQESAMFCHLVNIIK